MIILPMNSFDFVYFSEGIDVRVFGISNADEKKLMHHKFCVIDSSSSDGALITGSLNWSYTVSLFSTITFHSNIKLMCWLNWFHLDFRHSNNVRMFYSFRTFDFKNNIRIDSMAFGSTQNTILPIQTSRQEIRRRRSLFLTIQSVNGRSRQDVKTILAMATEMEDFKRLAMQFKNEYSKLDT